jgi:hypothetical protein
VARTISQITVTADKSSYLGTVRLVRDILMQLIVPLGWTVDYDNTDSASNLYTPNVVPVLDYKLFAETARQNEVPQVRFLSPDRRLYAIIFPGRTITTTTFLRVAFMIPGLVGDESSYHAAISSIASTTGGSFFAPTAGTSYTFSYELLQGETRSFELFVQGVSSGLNIAIRYNEPVPKISNAALPPCSLHYWDFEGNASGVTLESSAIGYAVSDSKISNAQAESSISPFNMSSYPIHVGIVDVEVVLAPMLWANVGAYAIDGWYYGRSTYPPDVVQGVIQVDGKSYRVAKSDASFFTCRRI